jgi:excisionase family DNA binding protein
VSAAPDTMDAMDNTELTVAITALAAALRAQSPVPDEPDTMLTVDEAADQLGVSRSLIYSLLRDGALESVKIGRWRFIPTHEVDRIIGGEAA